MEPSYFSKSVHLVRHLCECLVELISARPWTLFNLAPNISVIVPSLILGTSTSSTTESRLFVEGMRCFVGGGPRHIESSIFGNRVHGAFFEWLGLVLAAAWNVGPNPVLDVAFADDCASGAGSE